MAKKCTHNLAEQETACADGMCPLCLAKDLISGNDKCVKMRRKLEARIKTLKDKLERGRYNKKYYQQNIAYFRIKQQQWRQANKNKVFAHGKLRDAILAGKIIKPSKCSRCGKISFIQGHHANYSKPLIVEWLCISCHRAKHYTRKVS